MQEAPEATESTPHRWSRLPIHVLLWVAFPILALWAENADETPAAVALGVLARVELIAIVAVIVFSAALRSLRRGSLAVVALLVPTMLYGYVFTNPDSRLGLVLWALLILAGLALTLQLPEDVLGSLTAALNAVSLVLVLLNGVPAGIGAWDRHQTLNQPLTTVEPDVDPGENLPDIWYLVPDRYSREDTLAAYEGIDNSDFVSELRDRGFQVFDRAATNYPTSMLSIAASLSLRYLDDLDEVTGVERGLRARALLRDHELGRLTTSAGYEYVHLGSWADFTATSARAHQVLTSETSFAFDVEVARLTVAPALQSLLYGDVGTGTGLTTRRLQRIHGEHQVEVLRELASKDPDHPQFVFAHLIFPHGPYVFDEDGSLLDDAEFTGTNRSEGLRRQMVFTNRFLSELIATLQAREQPPVIILQSDEGELPPYFFDTEDVPWSEFSDQEHRMHNAILSAVYLPEGDLAIPEDMPVTAVNVLRETISQALGVRLPRLPDVSYSFWDEHFGPYRDVTDLAFSSP